MSYFQFSAKVTNPRLPLVEQDIEKFSYFENTNLRHNSAFLGGTLVCDTGPEHPILIHKLC